MISNIIRKCFAIAVTGCLAIGLGLTNASAAQARAVAEKSHAKFTSDTALDRAGASIAQTRVFYCPPRLSLVEVKMNEQDLAAEKPIVRVTYKCSNSDGTITATRIIQVENVVTQEGEYNSYSSYWY